MVGILAALLCSSLRVPYSFHPSATLSNSGVFLDLVFIPWLFVAMWNDWDHNTRRGQVLNPTAENGYLFASLLIWSADAAFLKWKGGVFCTGVECMFTDLTQFLLWMEVSLNCVAIATVVWKKRMDFQRERWGALSV